MRINQKGFNIVEGLLVLLIVGALGVAGWHVWKSPKNTDDNEPVTISSSKYTTQNNTVDNNNTQNTISSSETISLVGVLRYVDCRNAGIGCTDYVIILDDGTSKNLSNKTINKEYIDKRVQIKGVYIENAFGPGTPSVFKWDTIKLLN